MQVKKILCLLLCMTMLVGMLAGCGDEQKTPEPGSSAPTEESTQPIVPATENTTVDYATMIDSLPLDSCEKIELLIAQEIGFPMENLTNSTITGAEYAVLLDKLIEYAAPDKLDEWQTHHTGLRSYDSPLERSEAMAALYLAADFIGGYYDDFQVHDFEFQQTVDQFWELVPINVSIFDEGLLQRLDYYYGIFGNNADLYGAAIAFCTARVSNISGQFLFSYDAGANSFHNDVPPTYDEALLSVIRLISSAESNLYQRELNETEQQYLNMASERRDEITNAVTDCTEGVNGTIYYISNNGNDSNDGLSPDTAWATVERIWQNEYSDGDAILFERGGTWYVTAPDSQPNECSAIDFASLPGYPENAVIGAYGEGEKPVLRGDIEKANSPAFWELYSDTDGKKIWKTNEPVYDTTVIVFDEGEAWADEIMPWLDADGSYIDPDGSGFIVEEALCEDLTFAFISEEMGDALDEIVRNHRHTYYITGSIYLRCDAGNPAEVYDIVSVPQTASAIALNDNCAAYDLSLSYFTMNAAGVTSRHNRAWGQTFSNLEVGWSGGFCQVYNANEDADGFYGYSPSHSGCGIYLGANENVTLENCYIHHCGTRATVIYINGYEGMPQSQDIYKNFKIVGNLFENSGSAFHWTDASGVWNGGAGTMLSDFLFENNLVMDVGEGWVRSAVMQDYGVNSEYMSALGNGGGVNNENFIIRNNVFYHSSYSLLTIDDVLADRETPTNNLPIFEGNTYIQLSTMPLLMRHYSGTLYYPSEDVVENMVGDAAGTLVILEP